ncbi:MAG: hypothetical protein ACQEVA_05580 [Myxococcota bacterium]
MGAIKAQRMMLVWLVASLLSCSAIGCAPERGEGDFEPQTFEADAGTDTGSDGGLGLGEGPGAGTMDGTWLLVHERSSCVLGQEQVTLATYRVEIAQDGAVLEETRRACAMELSPVLGLGVRISDDVLETVEFIDVDTGLVSSLREDGRYISSTEVSLWGLDLENPQTDAVPTDPEDPAVIDSDGDGQPGVTYLVGQDCQRYNSQRQLNRYSGSFVRPNLLEGESTSVTDLEVYGGSENTCSISPDIISNDRFNRWKMARVDGLGGSFNADADGDGTITCDEITAVEQTLLEKREADRENCEGIR